MNIWSVTTLEKTPEQVNKPQPCVALQRPNPAACVGRLPGFLGGEALCSIPLDKPQVSPNHLLSAFNSLIPSNPLARNPAGHRNPRQCWACLKGKAEDRVESSAPRGTPDILQQATAFCSALLRLLPHFLSHLPLQFKRSFPILQP